MITWIVSSTVLILIVILLRQIFRKKISHGLQYILWFPVLLRLLIPVTPIESDFSIMNLLPEESNLESEQQEFIFTNGVSGEEFIRDMGEDVSANIDKNGVDQTKSTLANNDTVAGIQSGIQNKAENPVEAIVQKGTVAEYAVMVWGIGSLIMAAVLLGSNVRFYLRLKKCRVLFETGEYFSLPFKKLLPIYMVEHLLSPCLFGVFSPAVYVTAKIKESDVCTEYVIAHELCHYKRIDHIWALVRGLCLVIWWWNPFVWIAAKLSVQDGELACDEAVVRLIGEERRIDYGHTLINMIPIRQTGANLLCGATSMGGSKKNIKERLQTIVSKPKTFVWAAVVVCILVVFALVMTLTGASNKEPSDGGSGTGESEKENVSSEIVEEKSPVRKLTEEEKEALFAYIAENYAEDDFLKIYDCVSQPEFKILPKEEWDLSDTEEEVAAVIMMEQVVFWSNESYSMGPQWGSGLWKTMIYIGEKEGKLEVVDRSIPMDINDVARPSEANANEETLALIENLGITHSQYRDLFHQMEGLLAAKVDHEFDSYLDFSQEEYDRYITARKDYFAYASEQVETWKLKVIHIYDWSNRNYNYEDDGTPGFVDQDAEYYNCTEKVDTGKDNLTAEVVAIYQIGEHEIGQHVRITDENTGKVTEMEYRFTYIPQQVEWPDSSRMFIIGGRVLSETY